MKKSYPVKVDGMQFRQLLLQVRARVVEAGCAERLDAEDWLGRWLMTPNPAFGGALPKDVFYSEEKMVSQSADITAELMGKPDLDGLQNASRHW